MSGVDIMHVVPNLLQQGGAERFTCTLPRFLRNRYSQVVCVLDNIGTQVPAFPNDIKTECLHIPSSTINPITLNKLSNKLHEAITRYRPRIIHSHLWPAFRAAALATKKSNQFKHICLVHDTRPWLKEQGVRNYILRRLTKSCIDSVNPTMIAVSSDTATYTSKHLNIPLSEIQVLLNGVDLSEFNIQNKPINGDRVTFGTSSNFRPEKGHLVLLEAAKILKDKGSDFKISLAGGGKMEDKIRQYVKINNLSEHIEFCGVISKMKDFYAGCDVFILPSTGAEGLPLSILEAMAMRLPVIASSTPGTAEALINEQHGFIVPPSDSNALAETMQKFINTPSIISVMGEKAERRARDLFSFEKTAEGYSVLYDALIKDLKVYED